jgi:hypothetical protein
VFDLLITGATIIDVPYNRARVLGPRDVAIVLSVCSDDPIDTLEGATLDEVGTLSEDSALLLAKTLALALLKLARIPVGACSIESLYQTLERSRIEPRSEWVSGMA